MSNRVLRVLAIALIVAVGIFAFNRMMRDPSNIPHSATEKPIADK